MAAHRRASAREIILGIRTRLAAALEWDEDRIPIVAGKAEVPHLMGDREVLIRVLGERPDRQAIDGAGRDWNVRIRKLEIECRTRSLLDVSHEDRIRLTNATFGHIALEDQICETLESMLIYDSEDDWLTSDVVRLHDLSDPQRDKDAPAEWVSSRWDVEFTYDRALTQDRV